MVNPMHFFKYNEKMIVYLSCGVIPINLLILTIPIMVLLNTYFLQPTLLYCITWVLTIQ